MDWIAIEKMHFNLDRIVAFNWVNERLCIYDGTNEPFYIDDPNKHYYRKLCTACCMNMA